jgi:uncharacterized protein
LPVVWGGADSPTFESTEQAHHILGLMMRHWNTVNSTVRIKPGADTYFYIPILQSPDEEPPDSAMDTGFGEEWARGFAKGMGFHSGRWDDALEEQTVQDCLVPMVLLDMGENPDKPELVVDYARRESLATLIPMAVHELWRYWREHETGEAPVSAPFKVGPRVGRNDPCPCGSGKKFKKCCLH